ncbi:MAG: methyltransferase domain-containing protein [bacterium]
MKQWVPWWARIVAKLALSRLPVGYHSFASRGIFRHGHMDSPAYALRIIQQHLQHLDPTRSAQGYVALELGPGDSVGSALIAHASGASHCYLVDAGAFAMTDITFYQRFAEELRALGVACVDINECSSVEEVLTTCGGTYLTSGLASLQQIPDNSIDFIWSQAVLEHLRVNEFTPTMKELKRILKPQGIASHRIDLKDHLGGSLNNMRIPGRLWEQEWMASSGFYTNRIRYSGMLNAFRDSGFEVEIVAVDRWQEPPITRRKLAAEFQHLSRDDLRISGFHVVLH